MFRDVKEIVFFNNWLMLVMIKLPIVKLTSYRLSRSLVLYQSPGQLRPSVPLLWWRCWQQFRLCQRKSSTKSCLLFFIALKQVLLRNIRSVLESCILLWVVIWWWLWCTKWMTAAGVSPGCHCHCLFFLPALLDQLSSSSTSCRVLDTCFCCCFWISGWSSDDCGNSGQQNSIGTISSRNIRRFVSKIFPKGIRARKFSSTATGTDGFDPAYAGCVTPLFFHSGITEPWSACMCHIGYLRAVSIRFRV